MTVARVKVPESLCSRSIDELAAAVAQAAADHTVHLVILEGTQATFCRGLDFEQLVGTGSVELR